jgi:hypothetical protein
VHHGIRTRAALAADGSASPPQLIRRVSEDATVLTTAIAGATDADLILMAIEPELPLMLPGCSLLIVPGDKPASA